MIKPIVKVSVAVIVMILTSCSRGDEKQAEDDNKTIPEQTEQTEPTNDIIIEPLSESPTFPDAQLKLVAPKDFSKLKPGKTKFTFEVENYDLAQPTSDEQKRMLATSDKGQHIHFILNNKPYMAKYQKEFEVTLEDKPYQMIAFLSRSYHESVKSKGAFVEKQFAVGSAELQDSTQLYYSRPKGTYEGKGAEKIVLDFYLPSLKLSTDGYKVRVTIDGKEQAVLNEWRSYCIEGLKSGDHDITIELIDAEGEAVNPKMNTTTRTITVNK